MFSWRLLLATGEAQYADLIERTLFNVVATSPGSRRPLVLLRQHAASAHTGHAGGSGCHVAARLVIAARALVRGVVLPAERGAHVREPRRLRRHGGRRRRAAAPVRAGDPCGRRCPDGRVVAFDVETGYPADGEHPRHDRRGCRVHADAAGAVVGRGRDGARACRRCESAEASASAGAVEVRSGVPRRRRRRTEPAARALASHRRIRWSMPCEAASSIERGPEVLALESIDFGADVGDAVVVGEPVERDGRRACCRCDSARPATWSMPRWSPITTGLGAVRRPCGSGSRRSDASVERARLRCASGAHAASGSGHGGKSAAVHRQAGVGDVEPRVAQDGDAC